MPYRFLRIEATIRPNEIRRLCQKGKTPFRSLPLSAYWLSIRLVIHGSDQEPLGHVIQWILSHPDL